MSPAGFWRRAVAWSLDAWLLAVPTLLLTWRPLASAVPTLGTAFDAAVAPMADTLAQALLGGDPLTSVIAAILGDRGALAAVEPLQAALVAVAWPPVAVFVLLALVWHVAFEAGARHATPGQRALGLRVAGDDLQPVGIVQALARFVAGAASWLTLNIGHAMALAPPAHRALHDRLSGTRVLFDGDADARALPGWAKGWLWLQAALFCAACAWAATALEARMFAAVERALG